jgi:hypothetical protein
VRHRCDRVGQHIAATAAQPAVCGQVAGVCIATGARGAPIRGRQREWIRPADRPVALVEAGRVQEGRLASSSAAVTGERSTPGRR